MVSLSIRQLAFLVAPLFLPASAWAGNYDFKTLSMSGADNVTPFAVDENGTVVGQYTKRGFFAAHGFVWSKGTYTLVDGPGGNTSVTSINRNGLAAGQSIGGPNLTYRAFTFDTTTNRLQTVPTAPNGTNLDYYAAALNTSGRVVGATASGGGGSTPGVGWVGNANMSKLLEVPGTAPTNFFGEPATDINNLGDVVGSYAITGGGGVLGYLYHAGTYTSFDPAEQSAVQVSVLPLFINDAGMIGGGVTSQNEPAYGFTLYRGETTRYPITGARVVNVVGVTKSGEVIGTWQDTQLNWHGFTVLNGVVQSLDAPGATSTMVNGVNPKGTLVGSQTRTTNGHARNFGFIARCSEANAPCTR